MQSVCALYVICVELALLVQMVLDTQNEMKNQQKAALAGFQ